MKNLLNFTPHAFVFFDLEDCIMDIPTKKLVLNPNAKPKFTLEPYGKILRAKTVEKDIENLIIEGILIPNKISCRCCQTSFVNLIITILK